MVSVAADRHRRVASILYHQSQEACQDVAANVSFS